MIRLLVDNGYLAFQSGKWWEGSWKEGGFTAGMTHGDPSRGGRHGDAGLAIGRQGMRPVTDFIDRAISEQKPFFVWYAPFLPHEPHTPPAAILGKYDDGTRPPNVAKYYAMCDWFDQTCGELIGHLEHRGIRGDTIIVFLCDNGWAPLKHEADGTAKAPPGWWKHFAPRSKGSPFERGIRTPIMISWPTHVLAEQSDALASSLDLMPTLLTACGLSPPPRQPGINLLDPQQRDARQAVFGGCWSIHNSNPGSPQSTLQYRWCVERQWKLIRRHHGEDTTRYRLVHAWDDTPVRLFDVAKDPHETQNLATTHQEHVARLTRATDTAIPAGSERAAGLRDAARPDE